MTTDFENALRKRARQSGTPLNGLFEITGRCNFNCKMCYVHTLDVAHALRHELTTEQWIRIMDDAYDEGMLYATISGGECLLRPDFKELYLHLFRKGVRMSVLTNGSLITDEFLDFFTRYKPQQLQISLYGSNDDVYENVTGTRSYDAVIRVLQELKARGVKLHVALTPNRFNKTDMWNLCRYLRKHGYDFTLNPYLIAPREGLTREDFDLTEGEILEVLDALYRSKGQVSVPIAAETLPLPGGACEKQVIGMECGAGVTGFSVTWDGNMLPCTAMTEPRVNVVELGFHQSWLAIRENDRRIVRPAECAECPYRSVCAPCQVIRSKDLHCGHCNQAICHLTVSKVQLGLRTLEET